MGLSLERMEYLLAFLALGEGLLLMFYFGFGFTLIVTNAVIFGLLVVAAKTLSHGPALVAFYGMCLNSALHFFAVTQLVSHYLFYGGGIFFFIPLVYMATAASMSFLGVLISYSFWARTRLGQYSIVTGGTLKDEPLAAGAGVHV
ncbi:putative transmembrane protein [Gregarina niphandrodes]|uniref:Transmembrane protein n=1 Tax=Gregarina niphandrodes TaxID=110365 RepID=A0A023AXX5_GRENI|nr:putative transmembrane protein [Gregarina niphandrodes]EZG43489.1 putative transmembrane protein [Gregarina niphandrodes]|eukprot:XP_011133288.1 putative transmembrane protein [Gregarina niphandrodes]